MALDLQEQWFRGLTELRYAGTPKRIRALLGGQTVADTRDALLVYAPRRVVPTWVNAIQGRQIWHRFANLYTIYNLPFNFDSKLRVLRVAGPHAPPPRPGIGPTHTAGTAGATGVTAPRTA